MGILAASGDFEKSNESTHLSDRRTSGILECPVQRGAVRVQQGPSYSTTHVQASRDFTETETRPETHARSGEKIAQIRLAKGVRFTRLAASGD